ncbi:hypothetical protein BO224_10795 [Erysipelotrichaceae bacterium NYU-BL-E8]|uniref:Uncharacterized protein n=1 Tax=Ileibacterium valens TaxID=1862668 RepID=A0A1U7NGD1_9FIRM|nr:hypothetical protein BO224_10795 [Erysipelotrichaceae bacterium NYU-BL-E8]OLU38547.1 hypothetical protein BM735_09160 [Erysipelotrichaceae bacterium NYU-BL-F16]OLU40135.1 hypothetical protein BO222_05640 [Ileibacterium valens]
MNTISLICIDISEEVKDHNEKLKSEINLKNRFEMGQAPTLFRLMNIYGNLILIIHLYRH